MPHLVVIYSSAERKQSKIEYARVEELVDSLESGSSVHCGRAGSSPASRTKKKTDIQWMSVFFLLRWRDLKARPEQSEGKEQSGGLFLRAWESPWIPGYTR